MQRTNFSLIFGAFLLVASTGSAYATNHNITCDGVTSGQLNTLMTSGGTINPGDTIEITGICVGDTVLLPGVTLTNHNNSASLSATDGVQGEINLFGSASSTNIINGLTLKGFLTDTGDGANLEVSGSANLNLINSEVKNAQRDGIDITTNSSVLLQNTLIDGNGVANIADKNHGIKLRRGGVLNDTDGSAFSVISNNAGFGIEAQGAYVELSDTNFSGNTLSAISTFSTNMTMGGGTVTGSGTLPAIQALSASSVTLFGTTVSGPAGAILVASASSLVLAQSTISTSSTTVPAVEASATSSIVITGGDTITASSGIALEADHSSSIMHQALSKVQAGATNAAENITGKGVIQVQSSMDLGQGPLSGLFGIVWTGNIAVQQNSAFRMQGGSHVTGSVQLSQQSNAFFNCNNSLPSGGSTAPNCGGGGGAANQIDGTVQCPELVTTNQNPSSHVSNPTLVTVTALTANLFGSGSFAAGSPAANTCLNF